MNKAELIELICELDESGRFESKAAASAALDAVLNAIKKGLEPKDKNDLPTIQLIGFGTFSTKKRKARKGLNPSTHEPMEIPAKKAITFKAGKALKEKIN